MEQAGKNENQDILVELLPKLQDEYILLKEVLNETEF